MKSIFLQQIYIPETRHTRAFYFLLFTLVLGIDLISISKYGPATSCDSANYLSVAQSIVAGNGFVQFDDFQYLNAGPLYPLLLTPAYFFHLDPIGFAFALNLFCFFITVNTTFLLVKPVADNSAMVSIIPLLVFPYMTWKLGLLWVLSEMSFIALLLLLFLSIIRFLNNNSKGITLCLLIAGLLIHRFAFLFFLPGIFIAVFLVQPYRMKRFVWIVAFASIPFLVWLFRNYLICANPFGEHLLGSKFAIKSFFINLQQLPIWGMSVFGMLLAFTGWLILKKLRSKDQSNAVWSGALVLVLPAVTYIIAIFSQQELVLTQLPRYLLILWIPISAVFVITIEKFSQNNRGHLQKWRLFLYAGIGMCLMAITILKSVQFAQNGVGGFQTEEWQQNAIEHPLQMELLNGPVVSNFPDFIWLQTGKKAKHGWFINESKAHFVIGKTEGYLIWFNQKDRAGYLKPFSSYTQIWELKPIGSNKFFSVYHYSTLK